MRTLLIVAITAAALAACGSDSGGDAAGQPDAAQQDTGATDPGITDHPTPPDVDAGTTDPGAVDETPAGEDPAGPDPTPELPGLDCGPTPGTVEMGEECAEDCDCVPGLICYDQGYPGATNVCSRACEGGCGTGFKCLIFSPKHWNANPGMTLHTLCMPECLSLDDCARYGDHYTHCPGKSFYTVWMENTLAASTCQVTKTE